MAVVADTHAIVWFLEGSGDLSSRARKALREETIVVIPTISLAEIRFLYAKHRIKIDIERVLQSVEQGQQFRLHPLDAAVALALPTSLEIHDAIVCATALVFERLTGERVRVVTKDRDIRASGLVETVW